MTTDLSQLDPDWAWNAFEPCADRPWSRRLAAHLYRRAGFGATWDELEQSIEIGPAATVDLLCDPPAPNAAAIEFERSATMLAQRTASTSDAHALSACWLFRMLGTSDPLLEKLTLFWHSHFATSAAKVEKTRLMLDQNELLRRLARGPFEVMVCAMSRDPAMLIYLDSTTNRRIRPNENYARELMELFCLGVGNYSEKDIKEVARALTGREVLGERFHLNQPQHDTGSKSFLGASGNFDGDEAIRIVLDQPAAPRFIARKLVRFFVFDEPVAPDALIEPIATDLRGSGLRIGPVVRKILASNLFFSEHAIGRKVRSPVELGVGLLRGLSATTNLIKLAEGLSDLGQALFYPPNVKGWDGGRAWINSATLLGRANLVRQLLNAKESSFAKSHGGLSGLADRAGATSPEQTFDWLLELFVATAPPPAARRELVRLAAGGDERKSNRNQTIADVIHAMSTLPEFHLG